MSQDLNSAHYGIYGLSDCQDGSCVSQIIEIAMSGAIMLWLLIEFALQIKVHMRLNFSWQEVMLIQIFLCLAFNICFMIWSNVVLWYVLESLLHQFYFTTLVYYFAKKYTEKTIPETRRKPYIISLLAGYAVFCLLELGIFIYMVNSGLGHCKELAELIINAVMIVLALLFLYLAYQNQREEQRKFEEFNVDHKLKNPLLNIWIWASANILGQIASEVESALIYVQYSGLQCYSVQNNLETEILGPIFMALAEALPFCATLWFYSGRRKQTEESQSSFAQLELSSAQVDVDNRIELIKESSPATSNLTELLI